MKHTFRAVLREETRAEHARVDSLFSDLDISQAAGFARFCQIHLLCFDAMAERAKPEGTARRMLVDLTARLRNDLNHMRAREWTLPSKRLPPVHPMAIDYVTAGSRLGSQVLRKRWMGSADPAVRTASAYFSTPDETHFWRDVCQRLSLIQTGTDFAATVTRDTQQIFALFMSNYHCTARDLEESSAR